MTTDDDQLPSVPAAPDPGPAAARRSRLRRLPLAVGVLGIAAVGFVAWRQVAPVVSSRKYANVTYVVPRAPHLVGRSGDTIFRIDPTVSSLRYRIGERFVGRSASVATGLTNGIAGDLALDEKHPSTARVGEIVVNLEQLHSDNNLRDARIRQDFLESHAYPLAHFTVTSLTGLPAAITEGATYHFTMTGNATIKRTTKPVTWQVAASVKDGKLSATATTRVKLSSFDAGPISLSGLVSTDDDVDLTLQLIARDPTRYSIPTHITGPHAKVAKGGPSFKAAIQPILERSCASCHNPGQVGSEHWQLDTASDAAAVADGINTVTQTRYMPPWPASDKGVPLAHDARLSAAQLKSIADWASAGGPLDVPATTKIRPDTTVQALMPRKDVVLTRPTYTGSTANENDYRCFVLDPKLTTPMYLTGFTFLPDQIPEIHHVQVFHISAAQKAQAPTVEGKDGKPGWECYGGPGLSSGRHRFGRRHAGAPGQAPTFNRAANGAGAPSAGSPPTDARTSGFSGQVPQRDAGFAGQPDLVAGWVPGQLPAIYPEHSGILLEPGDALVLQIHYHYDPVATPDHSTMALQLDPISSKIKQLRIINPLAPVEIPCSPGAKAALCNRDASLAADTKAYGAAGAGNEQGLLFLCNQTVAGLQKRFDGTVAHSSCDTVVPVSGTVVSVLGHMHTLGKSVRMTLDPGTKKQKILLDIPTWNFGWQMGYALAKPLHVTRGEPLRLDCSWDRSLDPKRPQKYIVFAEGTEDEMCFGTYALIPDDQ